MNVWNGLDAYPTDAPLAVATIGNYDGVHLGHKTILKRVVDEARHRNLPSLLISFDPHPLSIVAPEKRPRLLQTRGQRLDSLSSCGLTDVMLLAFDADLAALDGREFIEGLLLERLGLASIHVGENFRFGHRRQGDLTLLKEIGRRRSFDVHGVPPVEIDGGAVSSTAIRACLAEGKVALARRMLDRPYSIGGEVIHGDGRGRTLDCPTANLELDNEVLPAPGVYVTEAQVIAGRFPSLTNVGMRPTVGGRTLTVETHLLEVDEDLYGERMEIGFLERLRDEMRFDNLESLADQIARDRAAATAYFENLSLEAS